MRTEFRNRPLVKQVGELVTRYANKVRAAFVGLLADPNEAPLFPTRVTEKNWVLGCEFHSTAASLGMKLTNTVTVLQIFSERTGTLMHVNARRLRRTFGTRAAQEGHGVLLIAELLDHSDTQHAGVYVQTRPEIAQRIDKAVAIELAPIAQAFKGVLITKESAATRSSDPGSRIRDMRISIEPLASCGQFSFCGLNSPLACYTCNQFEPWLDGPHEQLLDFLLGKRARQMETTGSRIATVHDRTILAVAYVVELCKQQKSAGLDE